MIDGNFIGGISAAIRASKKDQIDRDELLARVQSWRDKNSSSEQHCSWEQAAAIDGPELLLLDLSDVDLSGLDLRRINLIGCDLRNARLINTKLDGAVLEHCDLSGVDSMFGSFRNATLRYCDLVKASFREANFEGANFAYSDLEGSTMSGSLHNSKTRFFMARLQGVKFTSATLSQVDFENASTMYGVYLSGARLDGTAISYSLFNGAIGPELNGDYHQASLTYSSIKANLHAAGRYDMASKAYIKERRMEKLANSPKHSRRIFGGPIFGDKYGTSKYSDLIVRVRKGSKWWHPKGLVFYVSHTAKWFSNSVIDVLCSYGESPKKVLTWMVLTLFLIAPVTYLLLGGLSWQSEVIDEFPSIKSPLLQALYFYLQYVLYSIDTFTTADFSRLDAANDLVRLFSGLFALAGIFLTGLLGFVFGNRVRHA